MHGHVFQLAAEARKPDQYTKTMDALAKYVAVEMTPMERTSCPSSPIHQLNQC
jgi:hypothetical protein